MKEPRGLQSVLKYLRKEHGQPFGVNWTGAWDKMTVGMATPITINRGKGFEAAIAVEAVDSDIGGHMIYMGPYKITQTPTREDMLMFESDDGMFIAGL